MLQAAGDHGFAAGSVRAATAAGRAACSPADGIGRGADRFGGLAQLAGLAVEDLAAQPVLGFLDGELKLDGEFNRARLTANY